MRVMTFWKQAFLSVIALMMIIIISGCTSGANASTTDQNIPTIPPTTSTTSNVVVKTANATARAKSESILTHTNGKTLYYLTPDVLPTVACTTASTSTCRPLLFKCTCTAS